MTKQTLNCVKKQKQKKFFDFLFYQNLKNNK